MDSFEVTVIKSVLGTLFHEKDQRLQEEFLKKCRDSRYIIPNQVATKLNEHYSFLFEGDRIKPVAQEAALDMAKRHDVTPKP